jgi:RNA polymerase sigma-70 factor, ECF subfamily
VYVPTGGAAAPAIPSKPPARESNLTRAGPVYQSVTQTAPGSFEAFYHGTSGRLLRYAYGLTGDLAEAQDFTQEAYVRAWQRWKRLRDYDNPESWLRLVVTRLATDRWRWLRVRSPGLPPSEPVAGPDENLVVLVAELKRLPMPQRRALVLHYLLDRPVADIARETGASVNTVKSWLLRGRANLAAQLTEDDPGELTPAPAAMVPARVIAESGRRQRRRRNTVRGIAAFLTTAAATSAYLLFAPVPDPGPTVPEMILPYGLSASFARTETDGQQHALVTWQGERGESRVAVIDLKRDKLAGDPLDIGNWSEPIALVGFSNGGGHVVAENDYDQRQDWVLFTVDTESGKLLWQHRSNADGHGRAIVFRDTVHIVEETREDGADGHVTALDAHTGETRWTLDAPIAQVLTADAIPLSGSITDVPTQDDRLALLQPDGVLRVLDAATGRLLSVRSGITPAVMPDRIFGDFLYRVDESGLHRAPLTGEGSLQQIASSINRLDLGMCGRYLCAGDPGGNRVTAFDPSSGREVWRFTARMNGPQLSSRGMIFQSGTVEDSSVIFDLDGNEIGPPSEAGWWAQWVGNDHLLLTRTISLDLGADLSMAYHRRAEMSIYSFTNGTQTSLGEQVLRGGCGTVPGKFVCPTDTGFTLYHQPTTG